MDFDGPQGAGNTGSEASVAGEQRPVQALKAGGNKAVRENHMAQPPGRRDPRAAGQALGHWTVA